MPIKIYNIANNYEINNLGLYKRPTKAKYVINYQKNLLFFTCFTSSLNSPINIYYEYVFKSQELFALKPKRNWVLTHMPHILNRRWS